MMTPCPRRAGLTTCRASNRSQLVAWVYESGLAKDDGW